MDASSWFWFCAGACALVGAEILALLVLRAFIPEEEISYVD